MTQTVRPKESFTATPLRGRTGFRRHARPVTHHVELLIEYRNGKPLREPVHVEPVTPGGWRILYTPGFVLGIAAGDEFAFDDKDGAFRVLKRSGALAVQIFSKQKISEDLPALEALAVALNGTVDGSIERAAVLTIPVAAGSPKIEDALRSLCAGRPHLEWFFGNVYDPSDGITPLRWWETGA